MTWPRDAGAPRQSFISHKSLTRVMGSSGLLRMAAAVSHSTMDLKFVRVKKADASSGSLLPPAPVVAAMASTSCRFQGAAGAARRRSWGSLFAQGPAAVRKTDAAYGFVPHARSVPAHRRVRGLRYAALV